MLVRWYDRITNKEVLQRASQDILYHISYLHKVQPSWDVFRLRRHVDASLGRLPDRSWSRRPGRPRISQVV